MDATIGQAADAQARAFHAALPVGSILLTKLDGHAKGGGALSGIAATSGAPVTFLGTGEHVHDLEPFRPTAFVARLLGMGDMAGLMDHVAAQQLDPQSTGHLLKHLEQGRLAALSGVCVSPCR